MTAWRTAPVLQADTKRNGGKDHTSGSEPVSAAAIRAQPITENSARPRSFAGTIKQLFREVKMALTGKASAPQARKRRRRGDTQSGFRLTVQQLLRRVQRSIYDLDYFSCEPPDEIDEAHRLNLWHQNNQEGEYSHVNEAFNHEPQDHLSLHL